MVIHWELYLQEAYVVERELQTTGWGVAHSESQTGPPASPPPPSAPMMDGRTAPSYIGEVTRRLAMLDRIQKKRRRADQYR